MIHSMKIRRCMAAVSLAIAALACGGGDSAAIGEAQPAALRAAWDTAGQPGKADGRAARKPKEDPVAQDALAMIEAGRNTFRHDTFGDEAFWGDKLHLHDALKGAAYGGVGPGVSPETALMVGLKVDRAALPDSLIDSLRAGQVDLTDPATTIALLRLNAVVGVKGFFDDDDGEALTSVGIQCALCHSTVDDSLAKSIGERLDGWPNRDLNVGAIIALSPDLSVITELLDVPESTLRGVLASWGPGKFDAQVFLDGKAYRPDGSTAATLIPAAFGLAGVNLHTTTGWGGVTHWNALVATLEMHGQGTFFDPRLDDRSRFPVAARAGLGHVRHDPDLVTSKLAALQLYQLALLAPTPPSSSYDSAAAERGSRIFAGKAKCADCHVPPLYT